MVEGVENYSYLNWLRILGLTTLKTRLLRKIILYIYSLKYSW